MNDSVEVQSPPSKKFKQGDQDSEEIVEKENKPIEPEPKAIVQADVIVVEEKAAPQTPKATKNRPPSTPKSTTGKKRSREEIEASKAEREKKKKEKEEKEEARKLAWAQTLKERELKKKQKEEEKEKREEQRAKEKADKEERLRVQAEEKAKKEEQRAKEKAERDEKLKAQAEEKAKRLQEKEELKKKKEEEEKQKEEARLAVEAKKKSEQNKFKSFFSSVKKRQVTVKASSPTGSRWLKFEPRENQSVAPTCYRFLTYDEKKKLEENLKTQPGISYFEEIKSRSLFKRGRYGKLQQKDDDCKFINPELEKALKQGSKLKLLQFHRNYRPAYYGTFRKKAKLSGRDPFRKDDKLFDYNFDSDEEWEDEPEDAEEIDQNDEISDEEKDDEENDGFFVPHGYLSSDEEQQENDGDELFQSSAERLKAKQEAFQKMRKKKLKRLEIKINYPAHTTVPNSNVLCSVIPDSTWTQYEPILLLDPQHYPMDCSRDYVTPPKPEKKKTEKKKKSENEKESDKDKTKKDKKSNPGDQMAKPNFKNSDTPVKEKSGNKKESVSTPKTTPKTPKSASILRFAQKTDKEGVRAKLFNDAQKAQQRQAQQKAKKEEEEKRKQEELKRKAEEAKKSKEAEKSDKTEDKKPTSNGINILTPKRKKKVPIVTLSKIPSSVLKEHKIETKGESKVEPKSESKSEDAIVID